MVNKAQNSGNYEYLDKIEQYLEEHGDKLKEMNYQNAIKILENCN